VCQSADAGFRANKNKLNSKNAKRAMVQSRMVKKIETAERMEGVASGSKRLSWDRVTKWIPAATGNAGRWLQTI
jgi:hypothetical protein